MAGYLSGKGCGWRRQGSGARGREQDRAGDFSAGVQLREEPGFWVRPLAGRDCPGRQT